MKTKSIISIIATTLLLITSCKKHNVEIHTIINEDGSCSREFNITVGHDEQNDSIVAEFKDKDFAHFVDSSTMHFDESWHLSWSEKNDTAHHDFPISIADQKAVARRFGIKPSIAAETAIDSLVGHAQREFSTVSEMVANMPLRFYNQPYRANAEFKKTFKWFYTEYTYTETYSSINSMYHVPISRYVKDNNMATFWFTGDPDIPKGLSGREQKELLDTIEADINKWVLANMMYDICTIIAEHYDIVTEAPIDKETFLSQRDSLVNRASNSAKEMWSNEHYISNLFAQHFKTTAYDNILEDGPLDEYYNQIFQNKYIDLTTTSDYLLTMPGTIVDAGQGTIKGSSARFKLSPEEFLLKDYQITATSHVVNVWAYIMSALIIIVAISSFMYRRKR